MKIPIRLFSLGTTLFWTQSCSRQAVRHCRQCSTEVIEIPDEQSKCQVSREESLTKIQVGKICTTKSTFADIKKLTVLPFPVVCNWSYYRSPFLQPGPILQIPRALMWMVGVPPYQTLLKRPRFLTLRLSNGHCSSSTLHCTEWEVLPLSVRGPLQCTEVVPSVSPSLRVWNGHKVTISPSVGDSDGSIRRLLKSKNATKTFYLLFYCIMGEYSFILKCLYLEAIQTRWNKMLLDTNGNIRLWCTVSRLQVQIQFCTVLVFLCWSALSLSLSLSHL